MRVIAGRAKHLPLKAPAGRVTRPILDRVKVDLFNILGQGFDGCDVLDLYCGAGSLGIETISAPVTMAMGPGLPELRFVCFRGPDDEVVELIEQPAP